MDFAGRKGTLCYFFWMLPLVAFLVCLCGSNSLENKFKIFRSERDIFTNLRCDGNSCGLEQCRGYEAECVSNSNCYYCRCLDNKNTFIISEDDETKGKCVSDELIAPESVPNFRFWLENLKYKKCLKTGGGVTSFITATECTAPTLDMLWIWTATTETRLMNVKTLKCMQRQRLFNFDYRRVTMQTCRKNEWRQNMKCNTVKNSQPLIKIAGLFLHLTDSNDVVATWYSDQSWNSNKSTLCNTDTVYKGCYRFSDYSLMAYLNYSDKNPEILISAPIFKENDKRCKVRQTFTFTENGRHWASLTRDSSLFSIDKIDSITRELKINNMVSLKARNGTLVKLYVACGDEEHCVLLKLQSLPEYSAETISTPSPIPTTSNDVSQAPSQHPSQSKNSIKTSISFTTENSQKELNKNSESSATNSAAIAVPVALLLIVLALVLGYLVYYRRRKRTQVPQSNSTETRTANLSKGIYEDPDRTYETLKQDEISHNHAGTTFNAYCYPNCNGILDTGSTEEEYSYAKADVVNAHSEAGAPPVSDDGYQTLKQEKPPSSHFYNYPKNNNIRSPVSTEQEYTYAKDTEISSANLDKKATPSVATALSSNDGLYHTLEQEEPASTEQEYSYAKNTGIPSNNKQTHQGLPATPAYNDMYHTLEEPSKTQEAVYSTLEEPENVDNSQIVYKTLKSSDPVYNVLDDTNSKFDSRNIGNAIEA